MEGGVWRVCGEACLIGSGGRYGWGPEGERQEANRGGIARLPRVAKPCCIKCHVYTAADQ